jgi:hypothetical protein
VYRLTLVLLCTGACAKDPVVGMLDEDGRTLKHPYFEQPEPSRFRVQGSYGDPGAHFSQEACEWSHSLAIRPR